MKRSLLCLVVVMLGASACNSRSPEPLPVTSMAPIEDQWDDRSIFRSGLIEEAQPILDQVPGASVYHLEVRISDDLTSLQGQERVRYTNQEEAPLDAIYFQLFPNLWGGKSTVSAVTVDGVEIQPSYESRQHTLRAPLPAPLQPGQQIILQMDFQVEVPTQPDGNYGLFGYIDNILALDGFYPAIPVYDAAGWHVGTVPPNADTTYQDVSFYVVRVTAPSALTLAASGVEVDRSKQGQDQVVTFVAGPARDFYLAGSEQFSVISQTIGETKVNSFAFAERSDGAQAALDTASHALEIFSARYGVYPYTEFDVVSTPMQGATGIEYSGITGINYLAYDPAETVSGLPAPVILEATVAHEVVHQWFYNVVGNDQANEPWLDESVTQYVTSQYFLDRYGQQAMQDYRSSWLSRWERVGQEPIPIGLPAGSYQGKEYGAIVYGRGPLFIEALAQQMGQAKFDQFLRDYYEAHQWGIGNAEAFKQLAENQCGCDLTALFKEWVYSK